MVEDVKPDMMTTTSERKVSISIPTSPAMPENIHRRKKRRCHSREAVLQLKNFAVVTAVGVEAEEVAVIAVEIDAVATTLAAAATVVIKATALRSVGPEARAVVRQDRSILQEIKRKTTTK